MFKYLVRRLLPPPSGLQLCSSCVEAPVEARLISIVHQTSAPSFPNQLPLAIHTSAYPTMINHCLYRKVYTVGDWLEPGNQLSHDLTGPFRSLSSILGKVCIEVSWYRTEPTHIWHHLVIVLSAYLSAVPVCIIKDSPLISTPNWSAIHRRTKVLIFESCRISCARTVTCRLLICNQEFDLVCAVRTREWLRETEFHAMGGIALHTELFSLNTHVAYWLLDI